MNSSNFVNVKNIILLVLKNEIQYIFCRFNNHIVYNKRIFDLKLIKRTKLKPTADIQSKINKLLECKNILILGPKNSGKTSVALSYAMDEITSSKSLFFTTQRKEELIDIAIKLYPELKLVINSKLFIFQAPVAIHEQFENVTDQILSEVFLGIIQVIKKDKPDKIVFDEITSLLGFSNLNILIEVFQKLLNVLEQNNITALFTVAEPVSQRSVKIVNILKNEFAYYLNLKTNPIF